MPGLGLLNSSITSAAPNGGLLNACTSCTSTTTTWINWNLQIQQNYLSPRLQLQSLNQQALMGSTWYNWNLGYTQIFGSISGSATIQSSAPRILTPAQIAEQEQRDESLRRRGVERAAASQRAKRLLTSNLTSEQRDELEQHGYFTVRPISGRTYRIRHGMSMNIDLVDTAGRHLGTYCAHPNDMSLPVEDHMVAQALHLLHNEEAFLAIANRR